MTATLGIGSVQGLSKMSARGARNTVAAVACPAATSIGFRPKDAHAPGEDGREAHSSAPPARTANSAHTLALAPPEQVRADEPGDARHSGDGSEEFEAAELLLGREDMSGEHGEERRRRVEDRGEAARQVRLPPGDQRKGQGVVAEAEQGEGRDGPAALRERDADERRARPEQQQPRGPTRSVTSVSGGNSRTATPTKKNDPPHSSDSRKSSPHSRAVIARCARPRRFSILCKAAWHDRDRREGVTARRVG